MSSNLPLNVSFLLWKEKYDVSNQSLCMCLSILHSSVQLRNWQMHKKVLFDFKLLWLREWGDDVTVHTVFTAHMHHNVIIKDTRLSLMMTMPSNNRNVLCWLIAQQQRERESTPDPNILNALSITRIPHDSPAKFRTDQMNSFSDGQRTDTHTEIPLFNSEPQRIGYHINQLLLDLYRWSNSSQLTDCI